jgi:hypothetical protein
LRIIFNQSLTLKTVPKEWKNGQISAIFKKGNKSQAKNYRPVSLTSVDPLARSEFQLVSFVVAPQGAHL